MLIDPTKIMAQLNRLLSAFPPIASADSEETLRRYFEVLDEFTLRDIELTVDRYLRGKVPGFDGRFAPTPPMLAAQCRRARDERLVSKARARPLLSPPEADVPKDPRISEGLRNLARDLGTQLLADEVDGRRHALMARANARFIPDVSPTGLIRRLGGRSPTANDAGDFEGEGDTDAGEAS